MPMSAARQLALADLAPAELDARAAAAVTSYGVGTHSYNNSAEKREIDAQRKVVTARYEAGSRQVYEAPLLCSCPQREYPHDLSVHGLIRSEWWSKERRTQWPWSLMASLREEPSTERKAA
jgi:hypothetical protein